MKQLLVFGTTTFKITVPDDAKITYGPFSPPTKANHGYGGDREGAKGTLRIYQGTKDNIIACFAGVIGFRDLSMPYAEQIAKEEGATIWKDDEKGYMRENKVKVSKEWMDDPLALEHKKPKKRKG